MEELFAARSFAREHTGSYNWTQSNLCALGSSRQPRICGHGLRQTTPRPASCGCDCARRARRDQALLTLMPSIWHCALGGSMVCAGAWIARRSRCALLPGGRTVSGARSTCVTTSAWSKPDFWRRRVGPRSSSGTPHAAAFTRLSRGHKSCRPLSARHFRPARRLGRSSTLNQRLTAARLFSGSRAPSRTPPGSVVSHN